MMHFTFEGGEQFDEMEEEDEFNEMSALEMSAGRQVSNSVTAEIRHLIREIDDILEEFHKLVEQIANTDKLVHACRDNLDTNNHQFERALHRINILDGGKGSLMKMYERFKKIADQQNNINTDLKDVRDALLCELGKKISHKEYKGGLMGDNSLKINVLHKAIALLQRDVRNEDFATAGSMSTMGSRDRTLSSTMNSMASFLGLGGQRQQRSPDGFKHEAAV